jgi:hypothetical protein
LIDLAKADIAILIATIISFISISNAKTIALGDAQVIVLRRAVYQYQMDNHS